MFLNDLIGLRLVGHAEQARLQLRLALQMRLGEDRFDVVAEAQVVDELRVSQGLVVILEATELRVVQRQVAEVQRAPELRLAHAPRPSFVVVARPLVNTHTLPAHLSRTAHTRARTLCCMQRVRPGKSERGRRTVCDVPGRPAAGRSRSTTARSRRSVVVGEVWYSYG